MSKKVYRSAQGKPVDIGALQLQNETVRAVGNMGVNARGDRIDTANNTVDKRTARVSKQYKKQVSNVVDDTVVESKKHQTTVMPGKKEKIKQPIAESIAEPTAHTPDDLFAVDQPEPVVQDPTVDNATVTEQSEKPVGGLADAIAKARTVKQEKLKTPRQEAQSKVGVKRI